jgi:quercetin dioxygenase-like cupin family protein
MERRDFLTTMAFAGGSLSGLAQGGEHAPADQQPSAADPQPLILQQEDGERLVRRAGPTGGWPYFIKLDGAQGATRDFFVMTEVMAQGATIPWHKHDNAEEILILEEGGAEVMVGDKRAVAGPRSIVFIPRNTWASATNTSARDIHLVAVFSRHGFEDYMRAISVRPGEPLTPMSPEELTRLRTRGHATYWDSSKGTAPPGTAPPR